MGFPRDYLDFTTWYLQKKGYITRADNSDFTLTAEGVDYIETQRGNLPVLNKLLTDGKVHFDKSARSAEATREGSQRSKRKNGSATDHSAVFDVGLAGPAARWRDRRSSGRSADAWIRSARQERGIDA